MTTIVDQVERAIVFIHKRYPAHDVYLLGHSAGGHLAAQMLTVDWATKHGCAQLRGALRGCIAVSGLFDLAPVQRSYANAALNLTDAEVARLSPINRIADITTHSDAPVCFHVAPLVYHHRRCDDDLEGETRVGRRG